MSYLLIAVVLTAGTAFLIWLGDQITQFGVGNGISIIIFAGILSTLPSSIIHSCNKHSLVMMILRWHG